MNPWELGIDFGTSYTVAAVAMDGNVATVDVESNGRSRLHCSPAPSGVRSRTL
jgi:molecular chaperone DnaK (HSP70)